MQDDDVKEIYRVAQDQSHWCNQAMWAYTGFAVTINIGVWTYFLKAYIDSLKCGGVGQPLFIVVAAAISALIIGLWRWYNNAEDNNRIGFYPDILRYELEHRVGDLRYRSLIQRLEEAIPNIKPIFECLDSEDKTKQERQKQIKKILKAVSILYENKRLGTSIRYRIEISALAITSFLFLVVIASSIFAVATPIVRYYCAHHCESPLNIVIVCLVCFSAFAIGLAGLVFDICMFCKFQKPPCADQVRKALKDAEEAVKKEEGE